MPRLCGEMQYSPPSTRPAAISAMTDRVPAHDLRIETGRGALFARLWWRQPSLRDAPPPIVLFHDSLGSVDLWRSFPQALREATSRPVIAYDRLGFGRSDTFLGTLPADFIAAEGRDTLPLLQDAFGFTRFVACGHSVGGGMAVETASLHRESCLAVITMGAQAFIEERTLDGIRVARAAFQQPEELARLARYHGDKARWVVDAWTETWLSSEFAGWALDRALAKVACPLLAIHGEADEFGSPEHPRRIAGARGRFVLLPAIGHNPHREAEAEAVRLIGSFLAERLGSVCEDAVPHMPVARNRP